MPSHGSKDRADHEEYPFGMNRRQAMRYLGGGLLVGGTTSLSGCLSGEDTSTGDGNADNSDNGGDNQKAKTNPLDDPSAFEDVRELKWICDEVSGNHFEMYGPKLKKEAGLTFADGTFGSHGNTHTKVQSSFLSSGETDWDIVQIMAPHFGSYAAKGNLEPLDQYLDQYERTDVLTSDMLEPIREFYTKLDGKTYALPFDGDVHNLHYRPSYFNDEYHREQYKEETGDKLRVPQTWKEFNRVAKYFEENAEGVHGTQVYGSRPWNFAYFMDRAAANGEFRYFNEEMEPEINTPEAVEALSDMVEAVDYSPRGTDQFGVPETIQNWQQGNVVMTVWWIDLPEFTAQGDYPVVGDQREAPMPGYETEDGDIRRRATMGPCRMWGIPADKPKQVKEAAFYAIMRHTHPDLSMYHVADAFTGNDPFVKDHYTEKAAEQYLKPNPTRPDSGKGFEKNPPIFEELEHAKNHLQAGKANMANGYPVPFWPGGNSYLEPLAIHVQRALSGQETPQQALDRAAKKWTDVVDELGRDQQKKFYKQFLEISGELGYL